MVFAHFKISGMNSRFGWIFVLDDLFVLQSLLPLVINYIYVLQKVSVEIGVQPSSSEISD